LRPLLSFGLGAYNQQAFIAESVSAALQQTYSPLQVILSDDCSTDRTFEIMQELLSRYRGPHQVVLNRNPANLGLARHVNRIVQLAKGKLVVAASGDDLSLPERTASLYEAWDSKGRTATYVYSRMIHIDEQGKQITHPSWHDPSQPTHAVVEQTAALGDFVRTLKPGVCGAAGAYSPALFEAFGELPADTLHEDDAMTFRSLLMGCILFVDTPLVRYRLHGANLFNARDEIAGTLASIKKQEDRLERDFRGRARMYQLFAKDLLTARKRGMVSEAQLSQTLAVAKRAERLFCLQSEFMAANTARRARTLLQIAAAGAKPAQLCKFLIRLLPPPLFQCAKVARGWVHGGA